jgi:hypothetical protein
MTTQVTTTATHELGYAAARLLMFTVPSDRALIGWQPFSGAGWASIGGWETCKNEAAEIVNAVNRCHTE